jgi:hypothetical protein
VEHQSFGNCLIQIWTVSQWLNLILFLVNISILQGFSVRIQVSTLFFLAFA